MPPGREQLLGSTEPRLWTPPLRELTPETSYGFGVIRFAADVLGEPLDPWESWAVVHGGELLPDGRPRFRTVLLLVARQNGKTHLCKVLALYWLFVVRLRLVLGTSTNLDYARESWESAVADATENEALADLVPASGGIRRTNGEQTLTTTDRCRYKIAAATRKGGRSLSIDRLICDELREHRSWDSYNAAVFAMNARPYGQAWLISNMGDDSSVVLNALRAAALAGTDQRLGLIEYSAPDGCEVDDLAAIAAANPNLGRRIDLDTIIGAAVRAKAAGGDEEAGYRTEVLCQRVRTLNVAVDGGKWSSTAVAGNLDAARRRIAACFDISPDGLHAALLAAAVIRPGIVRVEVVAAWSGLGAASKMRADLPGWLARVRPRALGWFPGGPGAAMAADMAKRPGFPPAGCTVTGIKAETTSVCMGLAEQVAAEAVEHPDDQLMNAHILGAEKLPRGDGWVFSRKGEGHCNVAYAAAGAVHLARLLPPPRSTRLIVPTSVSAGQKAQSAKTRAVAVTKLPAGVP
jgi:hypothetical protein